MNEECKECGRIIRIERMAIPCQDGPGMPEYTICMPCYWLQNDGNAKCDSVCPIKLSEFHIQNEINDYRNSFINDIRDNWTKAMVKRSARDNTIALTKGQRRRASAARISNAQSFTPVMAEPIRVLIAECSIEELRDIWIELGRVMIDVWDSGDRKLWRRIQRVRNWIELDGKYRAYRYEPKELTDNEFIASCLKEMRGDIKN